MLDYWRGDPWFGPLQAPLQCVTDRPYPLNLTLALVRGIGLVGDGLWAKHHYGDGDL